MVPTVVINWDPMGSRFRRMTVQDRQMFLQGLGPFAFVGRMICWDYAPRFKRNRFDEDSPQEEDGVGGELPATANCFRVYVYGHTYSICMTHNTYICIYIYDDNSDSNSRNNNE